MKYEAGLTLLKSDTFETSIVFPFKVMKPDAAPKLTFKVNSPELSSSLISGSV
jgi:hypothetical protein